MNHSLLIGCGNLGFNILRSFLASKKKVTVLDKNKKVLKSLKRNKLLTISDNFSNLSSNNYDQIMLCVKPKDANFVLKKLSTRKEKKIISFIAGLKEKKIRSYFCNEINIIRLMPNLLIKVKKSTTGAYSSQISKYEKKQIEKDFSFFGNMIWLKNEKQMHFFTAFFGGGPAYISLFLEILSKILFHKGFDEKISRQLVSYLANGTVELAEMNNLRYGDIVKKVASKRGTTEQAIKYLKEKKKLILLIQKAILSAEKRSEVISKDL